MAGSATLKTAMSKSVASGHPDDLDELRASLRRGPRGSRVDRIIEHFLEENEAAALDSFRIEGAW